MTVKIKNDDGDFCVLEAVNDFVALEKSAGHRPAVCDSGCLSKLGAAFIAQVEPVVKSVVGDTFQVPDASALCVVPTRPPTLEAAAARCCCCCCCSARLSL